MRPLNRSRHDVVVVGARVAGSATAMLLARLGHDVLVVDQAAFPSDTVSTHSIARSGVVQLHRWGLLEEVLDSGAPAIRQVTFNAGGASLTRPIKHKAGVDFLVAPRRYVLDAIVAAAARRAGAQLRPGVAVTGVRRDRRGRVVGVHGHDRAGAPVELAARWVIGADGLGSRVARLVGAALTEVRPAGGAAQYAYYAGIPGAASSSSSPRGRSPACSPPTTSRRASGSVCPPLTPRRFAARPTRAPRPSASCSSVRLRSWPSGFARLAVPRRCTACCGCPTSSAQPSGPGWALVGDAGYHRDAITAYGISDAFHHAELLATALDQALAGEGHAALAGYQRQRDRALREIFEITCRLAAYPPVPTFTELQKQLSAAIDRQAAALAARPIPGKHLLATA